MNKYSGIIRKIRLEKQNNNKECIICDKYKEITELHHLVEVADLGKAIKLLSVASHVEELIKGVWICPNHHAIYHKLLSLSDNNMELLLRLGKKEIKKYQEIYEFCLELYKDLQKYVFLAEENMTKKETERDISIKINMLHHVIKKLQLIENK